MNQLVDRLYAQARINPIKSTNRVKVVTKMSDGRLRVVLNSSRVFYVSAEDELFQTFIVYTVLANV